MQAVGSHLEDYGCLPYHYLLAHSMKYWKEQYLNALVPSQTVSRTNLTSVKFIVIGLFCNAAICTLTLLLAMFNEWSSYSE